MFSCCSSIPRPEYPRPDRQRGRIEGVDWREQIIVPFCWESLAAWGEGDAACNAHYYSTRPFIDPLSVTHENHRTAARFEVGWYRKFIEIPTTSAWDGKRAILTIGAADFFTDCWCNGVHLGHHEGGYVPFEFDLTDALTLSHAGGLRTAMIVIRVEDPMDNREQPVGKQWGWYTTTSGFWQTVYIELRSIANIESFKIFTDIDKKVVRFHVSYVANFDLFILKAEIIPPNASAHRLTLSGDKDTFTGHKILEPLVLWDTTSPQIYHVVFRLFDPEGCIRDEVRSYFGMRKISTTPLHSTVAPRMLCLNNQPIYLRGALYQSYHPDGVYTASKAETLRHDIAYARDVGFDFLRIHIKLDDPLLLYYADTIGILIMQDFPNFGEGGDTPTGRQRFVEMMQAGIKRDFNHPSIIAWCIFNESWGLGGQTELIKWFRKHSPTVDALEKVEAVVKVANASAFKWIHETWLLAKSLDPTRLIEDMSVVVWDHRETYGHVDTDINSWHFYIDDYYRAKAHIENVVAKTFHGSTFNYGEGYSQRDVPLINSEYGGVGALDGDCDISWTFKFLTNELRRHSLLSAYIYTELTDVEWEHNGFLNYDRTPKEFGYSPKIVNQGDVLPINAPPIRQIMPGETIEIEILASHFSRHSYKDVTLHWRYSGIDTLGICHVNLDCGNQEIAFRHFHVELARCLRITAPIQPMLCTLAVSAFSATGEIIAENYVEHFVSKTQLQLQEDRGHTLVLRRRVTEWHSAEWTGLYGSRHDAGNSGTCHGRGAGFFEWLFAEERLQHWAQACRVRVLVEVSACREGTPQTDSHRYPSQFELLLNGVRVHRGILPDHPHDGRGALRYLRGGRGAYGFLVRATIENGLLRKIAASAADNGELRFRCAVRDEPLGGLTVYDFDAGRYPISPTICIEWKKESNLDLTVMV